MSTIKRWAVVAALLMAGCGSRVAYAADAVQNMRIIGGSLVLENGSTVAFNGTLTVAPASTATWIMVPGSTAVFYVVGQSTAILNQLSSLNVWSSSAVVQQNGAVSLGGSTATYRVHGGSISVANDGGSLTTWSSSSVFQMNGAPDLSTAVFRLNGAPDLSTAVFRLNGAPDLSTATFALRGQVSSMTVIAVAGSTATVASVAVSPTVTTQILATNAGRFHGEVLNLSTTDLYVGSSPAAMNTHWRVTPNQAFTWDVSSPLYGLSATGTIDVRTLDVTK